MTANNLRKLFRLVGICITLVVTAVSFVISPASAASNEHLPGVKASVDRSSRLSKQLQSEIGVFGGDYLGDEWLNTWDVGAH